MVTLCVRPVDALEMRDSLLKQVGSAHMRAYYETVGVHRRVAIDDYVRRLEEGLCQADPYFVSGEIGRLIGAAAPSVPSLDLTPELLPTRSGFVLFQDTVPLPSYYADGRPEEREGDGDLGR